MCNFCVFVCACVRVCARASPQTQPLRDSRPALGEGKPSPSAVMPTKLLEAELPPGQPKPTRTGAIKPQALKVEEGKA